MARIETSFLNGALVIVYSPSGRRRKRCFIIMTCKGSVAWLLSQIVPIAKINVSNENMEFVVGQNQKLFG